MAKSMTDADRSRFQARLEGLKSRLQQEIRDTLLRVDADRYALLAEQVHDTKDHSIAQLLVETGNAEIQRDAMELDDTRQALERLHNGRYGSCVVCGAIIPDARLDAYPTAKRCLPCQTSHERNRR